MEELADIRTLARRLRPLRLTQQWLLEEAEAGRIPSLRAGRALVFNVQAVEQALARRASESRDAANPDLAHEEQQETAHVAG